MAKNKLKYSKEGREIMKAQKMGYNATGPSGANLTALTKPSETPVAKPPPAKKYVKKTLPTKAERRAKKAERKAAKKAARKAKNIEKSSKKKVKAPAPAAESDSEDDMSDDSNASDSDSGSDEETKPQVAKAVEAPGKTKTNGVANGDGGVKLNGTTNDAIKSAPAEDSTSESSASSDDEDESVPSKSAAVAQTKNVIATKDESDDDSIDDDEEDSEESENDDEEDDEDSDDEDEVVKGKGAVNAKALNGDSFGITKGKESSKVKAESEDESEDGSGDDESSDSSGDSADSSDSSEDDSDEEMEDEPVSKKRKAEDDVPPPQKKAKTELKKADSEGDNKFFVADTEGVKNLFVGNLSWNVDEDWLTREFEGFGELSSVRIIVDKATGRSKGYGYVEYVKAADAARAHKEMKEAQLDSRPINLDFATPRKEGGSGDYQSRAKTFGDELSEPSDTLFVGNLSFDANEDVVGQEFGNHATVLGVRMPTDPDTGRPKGYGYVQFGSVEDAQTALEAMKGAYISGRPIRLDFGKPRDSNGGGGRGGGRGFGGGFGGGRGRGGFDRGGRGGGRGRGGFGDRGGRGGARGGRGGSTNRGGFGDFQGKKVTF